MTTELSPPKGHGLVRVAHSLREHVTRPSLWTRSAGTDFWANLGPTFEGIAADELLSNYGWTLSTPPTYTPGTLADLLSSADVGTPNIAAVDTAGDFFTGPQIFGDYEHGLLAGQFLGYMPTKLCLEAFGNFAAVTGAETTSGFGLSTGASLTATNHVAFIYSDGTNFAIRGTPGTGGYLDLGSVADTSYHHWKIEALAGGPVRWWIDGSLQGSITLVTDLFPTGVSGSVLTTTGINFFNLGWIHVYYE